MDDDQFNINIFSNDAEFRPNKLINPRLGRNARYISFSREDFPAPLGPVTKWNEPSGKSKVMSLRTSGPVP